jgi:DNA-binding transcriptional ArsR family regulator
MVIYREIQLDNIFGALANRTRREILDLLTRSEHSVLELAGRFDMSQPAVTKHLKVLERAGLIQRVDSEEESGSIPLLHAGCGEIGRRFGLDRTYASILARKFCSPR